MASMSQRVFLEGRDVFEETRQIQSLPSTQSQKECISEDTKCIIFVVAVVAMALLMLSEIAVGSCTAAGCINVKVGGGLIIGMSVVGSCLAAGLLKLTWEEMFDEDERKENLQGRQKIGCVLGAVLMANITGVVIGVLSVSSIMSPMVGGILLATVVPILPTSVYVIGLLIKGNND